MDAEHVCELGDGCLDHLLHPSLLPLAKKLYSCTGAMPPDVIYRRVLDDDVPVRRPHLSKTLAGGVFDDPRLLTASVADVSVTLLQFIDTLTEEAESVGFEKYTFRFTTLFDKGAALWLDQHARRATSSDVLCCLSRSLDVTHMTRGLWEDMRLPGFSVSNHIESLDDDLVTLRHSDCLKVFETSPSLGRSTSLWVLLRSTMHAVRISLVHSHWERVEEGTLRHLNLPGVVLQCHKGSMGIGGIFELHMPTAEWPWWMNPYTKHLAAIGVEHVTLSLPCSRVKKRPREEVNVDDLVADGSRSSRCVKRIVKCWARSSNAVGRHSTTLLRPLRPAPTDVACNDACRFVCGSDNVKSIFLQCFSPPYVQEVLERIARDADMHCYEVYLSFSLAGAITFYLFETEDGVAMLIDTFGVATAFRDRGVGREMFHFCRRFCEVYSSSYYLLAQCSRSKDAKQFWQEKLDPSSEARDVMLQAFQLGKVHVQMQGECEVKGRRYFAEE